MCGETIVTAVNQTAVNIEQFECLFNLTLRKTAQLHVTHNFRKNIRVITMKLIPQAKKEILVLTKLIRFINVESRSKFSLKPLNNRSLCLKAMTDNNFSVSPVKVSEISNSQRTKQAPLCVKKGPVYSRCIYVNVVLLL